MRNTSRKTFYFFFLFAFDHLLAFGLLILRFTIPFHGPFHLLTADRR
jgi:hypothetical protein